MTDDRFAVALLGTFESLRMAPTFARGRRDERAGHVRQLTVSGSLVVAQVRGPEDARAFRARIAVRGFGAADWARVERALAQQARFTADLLAGRMPAGVGAVFAGAGLSLLPLSLDEVAMDCSCERWPMPCVHLAATTYALVRSFEEDPFGVFTWRGRSRDELLTNLRELRSAHAVETGPPAPPAPSEVDGALGDPADFWGAAGPAPLDSLSGVSPGPEVVGGAGDALMVSRRDGRPGSKMRPDALLDQLDPPPLAQDGRPIVELLRPAYRALPDG